MGPRVDDLVALLRGIGAAPAPLIGNSWGAFICLLTAIQHPDVVRSLVLEEPPLLPLVLGPGTHPHPAVLGRSLARHPRATLAVLLFGTRTFAPMAVAYRRGDTELAWQLFARGMLGADAFAGLPAQRRQQMRANASPLRAELRAGFPPLPEPGARTVPAPALLLTGEKSPAVVRLLSGWLAELLPDVEQLLVPDASHLCTRTTRRSSTARSLASSPAERRRRSRADRTTTKQDRSSPPAVAACRQPADRTGGRFSDGGTGGLVGRGCGLGAAVGDGAVCAGTRVVSPSRGNWCCGGSGWMRVRMNRQKAMTVSSPPTTR